jgi:hypothetical protein
MNSQSSNTPSLLPLVSADLVERDDVLRLVLIVQPQDVPGGQVPLAQARAQRHFQSPARAW